MFNEEQKRAYITEKQSLVSVPDNFLTRQFNKLEEIERQLGKDACNFTMYEILEHYKNLNTSSLDSLTVLNSHLSLYTEWCMMRNLVDDCQNHYAEINIDTLNKCVNRIMFDMSFVTKEKIYEWIKQTINPCDAFTLLALFEGIKGKDFCEIVSIKMSDFDGNKLKLCSGKVLEVSSKLKYLAEASNETLEIYSLQNVETPPKKLIETGCVIKAYYNANLDATMFHKGRRLYTRLVKNLTYLGVNGYVTANDIHNSGKVHHVNTYAEKHNISAKEALYQPDLIKEMIDKYNFDLNVYRMSFLRKYGEYLI